MTPADSHRESAGSKARARWRFSCPTTRNIGSPSLIGRDEKVRQTREWLPQPERVEIRLEVDLRAEGWCKKRDTALSSRPHCPGGSRRVKVTSSLVYGSAYPFHGLPVPCVIRVDPGNEHSVLHAIYEPVDGRVLVPEGEMDSYIQPDATGERLEPFGAVRVAEDHPREVALRLSRNARDGISREHALPIACQAPSSSSLLAKVHRRRFSMMTRTCWKRIPDRSYAGPLCSIQGAPRWAVPTPGRVHAQAPPGRSWRPGTTAS